jgi:ribonuclease HI
MISSNIRILQVNLNKYGPATENALQIAIELKVDLIVVQEPWLTKVSEPPDYSNARSTLHQGFTQILPHLPNPQLRPRTLVYVSRSFSPLVSIATSSPLDPDLLIIDITEGNTKVQLVNIYNETDQAEIGPKTLARCLYQQSLHHHSILLGDFNTHHPWWDPLGKKTDGADDLVEWIEQHQLELINTLEGEPCGEGTLGDWALEEGALGKGTFFRSNMTRESVIDLTLATSSLASRIQDWQILPGLGSDHNGILFTVFGTQAGLLTNPTRQMRYNTQLANWELFTTVLQSNIAQSNVLRSQEFDLIHNTREKQQYFQADNSPISDLLDSVALALTDAISGAAKASIPVCKPGARPKPWWNPELKDLRQDMIHKQRHVRTDNPQSTLPYLQSKNTYFQAIKRAKREHWNQFLEKEDPKSIFKAMSYTKDRRVERIPPIKSAGPPESLKDTFQGKCDTFRDTLFPTPPVAPEPVWDNYAPGNWNWPSLTMAELDSACSATIKGKTPGPDAITQDIIRHAYSAVPDMFYKVYSTLLDIGHHPQCWKQATGVILKKPAKRDDSDPKSYRVISLLNCLGKVSERIFAQRLSHLAEMTELLHPTQVGGRLKKSAIDAALLLYNEVETNRRLKRKTSTLFMDVKGAFDHVAKNQLLGILHRLLLPVSLIAWVSSFLSNRLLRLSFDGQTEEFRPIDTGIPQGSPISPILFLIYIRELFPSRAVKFISYMDDISLTISSTSLKKNVKILAREAAKIFDLGAQNAIQFDLIKTELLHFTTSKEVSAATLTLPDGKIVESKETVRWLGIWFDPALNFKEHVARRTSQARSAFQRMARLANTQNGLSPFAIRQLYLACVTSIADYGSVIWWKGQAQLIRPLQALQNLALRKILGVFKTAPIVPMEVEAALVPPSVRLNTNIRKYAFRALKLSPTHPLNVEMARLQPPTPSQRMGRPTQLERIRDSIQGLADLETLESIEHFKYAPWDRSILYTVEVNPLSKEDAAQWHNSQLNTYRGKNVTTIYTDASSTPDGTGIGIGIVAKDYSQPNGPATTFQSKSNLGDCQLVYNGELEAVTQAVEYASRIAQPGQEFKVYSDNQAGLNRLRTPSDAPGQACQIRTGTAAQVVKERGATISLNWVPGHTKIEGNEMADSLAKEATELEPESEDTSFALLGLRMKQIGSTEWKSLIQNYVQKPNPNPATYSKKYDWKLRSKIELPSSTKREQASAFYQLKLGHGYLKSYLHRLGHSSNDLCRCGKRETAEHLLLNCRDLAAARWRLRDGLGGNRLSLKLLLHTKSGIEKTLRFLKETGIVTRKWHLERRQNEEEDEEGEGEEDDEDEREGEEEGEVEQRVQELVAQG